MPESNVIMRVQWVIIGGLIAVILALIIIMGQRSPMERGGLSANNIAVPPPPMPAFAIAEAEDGAVRVPLADLTAGEARFYRYDGRVEFVLLQLADRTVRSVFNACGTCYSQRMGFSQKGDSLACRSCGDITRFQEIGSVSKECTPIQLQFSIEGGKIIITEDALRNGTRYF